MFRWPEEMSCLCSWLLKRYISCFSIKGRQFSVWCILSWLYLKLGSSYLILFWYSAVSKDTFLIVSGIPNNLDRVHSTVAPPFRGQCRLTRCCRLWRARMDLPKISPVTVQASQGPALAWHHTPPIQKRLCRNLEEVHRCLACSVTRVLLTRMS